VGAQAFIMTKPKITNLIFDCGNVLVAFNIEIICQKLSNFSPFSPKKIFSLIYGKGLLFEGSLHHQFEIGQLKTPDFFRQVKKAIQANSSLTLEKFKEISTSVFKENSDIIELLENVKQNFKISLLSNTNEICWNYLKELPVIKNYFDEKNTVLSFLVGAQKPEKAIYETALNKFNCQANQTVLIDDEPLNIESFVQLGGRGIKYNCQKDSLEKLSEEIRNLSF